jgi:L-lactate utilization protein LutB
VDETDLGEWIIQLAHQTPSHMVMPAIHMTKEEVAEDLQPGSGGAARCPTSPSW